MRLVKQVVLFSRDNTKIYEIDLCELGRDQYVVNYRQGTREKVLSEGTKTETPVARIKAEDIYNALEAARRGAGYHGNETDTTYKNENNIPTDTNWQEWPTSRKKAVLQRLDDAVAGNTHLRKPWKTSRVIWMAGFMGLKEAVRYIMQLALKGDEMQRYASAWALTRLKDKQCIPSLQELYKSGIAGTKRLAGLGLLQMLEGEERNKLRDHYLNSLPEPVKNAIADKDEEVLAILLQERVKQVQTHYNMLEHLYALSLEDKWIRQPLKETLQWIPLRPNHFKHIRHLFKMTELCYDFELLGILACKFEREYPMFKNNIYFQQQNIYVDELGQYLNTKEELLKPNSRIAFSNKTRNYFIKRTNRYLNNFGKYEDLNYVRMATGLLVAYTDADRQPTSESYRAVYIKNTSTRVAIRHPENAKSTLLLQILFGNSKELTLNYNQVWQYIDVEQSDSNTNNAKKANGLLQQLFSFFKKKKTIVSIVEPIKEELPTEDETPFIQLWNQMPQAFVQLLIHGKMKEVHVFALNRLQTHPEYNVIKQKIDNQTLQLLLSSPFELPAHFGFDLVKEKYNASNPDRGLVKALLHSSLGEARETGKSWAEANTAYFFEDSEWLSDILFSGYDDIRTWASAILPRQYYSPLQAELICGRVVSRVMGYKRNNDADNELLTQVATMMEHSFPDQLAKINMKLVQDMMLRSVTGVQVFGLRLFLLKKGNINYDELSSLVLQKLLHHKAAGIRKSAIEILEQISTQELLKRQELLINCVVSQYGDVRIQIRPTIKRMAEQQPSFGNDAVVYLIPLLLRKETEEGMHQDLSVTLQAVLIKHIANADKELVLRLVYAHYIPAQRLGIMVLEEHVDADTFSIRQIIALGNHETLLVREWCWQYFNKQPARIRYEREETIRLLDAKWEDTRTFAKQYFKEHFSEADWTPEVLVGIADSVRPDIEAYGRELITRFFTDTGGEEYLIKLSQHPSIKMQLFATNYLERFATGEINKLQSLEFYFRSVLTRVNKARTAKNRIFTFLLAEGKKSQELATFVNTLIAVISATVSIEDKAKCIEILYELNKLYNVKTPVGLVEN